MSQNIYPMSLSEILDRTVRLIGKTISRTSIISLLCIVPPLVLIAIGLQLGISAVSDTIARLDHDYFEFADIFNLVVFPVVLVSLGFIALMISTVWANLGIIKVVSNQMLDKEISWQDALSSAGSRVLTLIGFLILVSLAYMAIIILPYGILIAGVTIDGGIFLVILGVLLLLGSFVLVAYLSIRWFYGYVVIAHEGTGVMETFSRSINLVDGMWWRTFGIALLLSLISSMAISLISTPLFFLGFIGPYIDFISQMASNSEPDPYTAFTSVTGFIWGYLLSIAVMVILTLVIEPVYMVVMYFDARARKGEFEEEPPVLPDSGDSAQLGENWQNVSV